MATEQTLIYLPGDLELSLMHLRDVGEMDATTLVRRLGLHLRRHAVDDAVYELMRFEQRGWARMTSSGGAVPALAKWAITEAGLVELDRLRGIRRGRNFPRLELVKPEPAPRTSRPRVTHDVDPALPSGLMTVLVGAELAGMAPRAFTAVARREGLLRAHEGQEVVDRERFWTWWEGRTESVKAATEADRGRDITLRKRKRRAARTKRVEQTTQAITEAVELRPLVVEAVCRGAENVEQADEQLARLGARVDRLAARLAQWRGAHVEG